MWRIEAGPAPALDDDGRLPAGPRARLGPAGRGSRVGEPADPAHPPARRRAPAGPRNADLGDRRRVRPGLPRAARSAPRAGNAAPAARPRAGRRYGLLRSLAAAVARLARRGARGRPDRLRAQAAPQHDRRSGRDPVAGAAALANARALARQAASGSTGAGERLARRDPGPAGDPRLGLRPGRRAPRRHRDRQHRGPDRQFAHRGSRGRGAFRALPAAHPGPAAGGAVPAALTAQPVVALRRAGGLAPRPQGGRQGRRRLAERRLCVGPAWRLSPLPRALRPSHRGDADGYAHQPATRRPSHGRQPFRRARVSRLRSASRTRRSASARSTSSC